MLLKLICKLIRHLGLWTCVFTCSLNQSTTRTSPQLWWDTLTQRRGSKEQKRKWRNMASNPSQVTVSLVGLRNSRFKSAILPITNKTNVMFRSCWSLDTPLQILGWPPQGLPAGPSEAQNSSDWAPGCYLNLGVPLTRVLGAMLVSLAATKAPFWLRSGDFPALFGDRLAKCSTCGLWCFKEGPWMQQVTNKTKNTLVEKVGYGGGGSKHHTYI